MNTKLIRLASAALALCTAAFLAHADDATTPPPATDPVATPPSTDPVVEPTPRPALPDSVRELLVQFNTQRRDWLQERNELLKQLRGATEEERQAILQQLREEGHEFRQAQRELAKQIREELRRLRDERRAEVGG